MSTTPKTLRITKKIKYLMQRVALARTWRDHTLSVRRFEKDGLSNLLNATEHCLNDLHYAVRGFEELPKTATTHPSRQLCASARKLQKELGAYRSQLQKLKELNAYKTQIQKLISAEQKYLKTTAATREQLDAEYLEALNRLIAQLNIDPTKFGNQPSTYGLEKIAEALESPDQMVWISERHLVVENRTLTDKEIAVLTKHLKTDSCTFFVMGSSMLPAIPVKREQDLVTFRLPQYKRLSLIDHSS